MRTEEWMRERELPANEGAERTLLGSILLDNTAFAEVSESIQPDDFSLHSHRVIYFAMMDLIEMGTAVDGITLAEKLAGNKELEAVGGMGYVGALTDGMPRRSSLAQWIEIVKTKAALRRLIHSCISAIAQACEHNATPDVCAETVERALLEITAQSSKTGAKSVGELLPSVLHEISLLRDRREDLIGYTTGIPSLDIATTGIRPGEYWVIGATPSRGKTVLGTQIAIENAKRGHVNVEAGRKPGVLIFSYEMKSTHIVKRLLPNESNISAGKIRAASLGHDDWAKLEQAAAEIGKLPLFIEDPSDLNVRCLAAKAKLYIRRFNIGLIVVDYLQQLHAPGKEERERVSNASNALRLLAKNENVAVVALSQLRRPQNENDLPSMHALKESGDIEAHAHTVLLLHRPKTKTGDWSGEDLVIVGKQREGDVGHEPVSLVPDKLRFVPREASRSSA